MSMRRALSILLCFAATACPGDDGGGDTTGATASSTAETGSGTGMSTSTTSMSSTDATQGGTGSTTEASTTEGPGTGPLTSTSEASSSSSTAAGSAEGGDACDPETHDHPCLQCFVDDCCKSWTACLADEGCSCVIDCHVIEGGSLGSCESQCNSDGELYESVFFCGQMYCLGTCEWDCC